MLSDKAKILTQIRRHPKGLSRIQLSIKAGVKISNVHKRVYDLKKLGFVYEKNGLSYLTPIESIETRYEQQYSKRFQRWLNRGLKEFDLDGDTMQKFISQFLNPSKKLNFNFKTDKLSQTLFDEIVKTLRLFEKTINAEVYSAEWDLDRISVTFYVSKYRMDTVYSFINAFEPHFTVLHSQSNRPYANQFCSGKIHTIQIIEKQ